MAKCNSYNCRRNTTNVVEVVPRVLSDLSVYKSLIRDIKERSIKYESKINDLDSLREFYTYVALSLKGY